MPPLVLGRDALDFDADAGRVRHDLQLLDADAHRPHPPVLESEAGDPFRQGFNQFHMAFRNDRADAVDHVLVIDHRFKPVADGGGVLTDGQIEIHPDGLGPSFLMPVYADMGIEAEITDEDMPDRLAGIGDTERLHIGHCGLAVQLAWRTASYKIMTHMGTKATGMKPVFASSSEGAPLWDAARGYQRIILRDVVTEVRLGLHPWERHPEKMQRVVVNVELFAHLDGPFTVGGVEGVLNYDSIRDALRAWPQRPHTDLLETLIEDLIAVCFHDARVEACRVSILKPDIFNEAAGAGLEVYRRRNEQPA